jgi:pimeloyl-ACP methyl ester carboxylesterase
MGAVTISHGWSGAVNERVFPLAERLAALGYAVLAFDHRGFGGSEGPRARCDPNEQVRDVSHGLTFLSSLDRIDPDALGVVGVSFGGAIAVAAGAADPRVKATVSIVGVGDAERWLRSLRPYYEWVSLRERLAVDRRARVVEGKGERVDFSLLMPGPPTEAMETELELMRGKHPDGYPLENAELAIGFAPEQLVERIAPRAVAFIGVADDSVVGLDETLAMYQRAGEPRELTVLPQGNHGGPLGPLVDTTATIIADVLARHLRSTPVA